MGLILGSKNTLKIKLQIMNNTTFSDCCQPITLNVDNFDLEIEIWQPLNHGHTLRKISKIIFIISTENWFNFNILEEIMIKII